MKQHREELGLCHDHRCCFIFDIYNGQTIDGYFKLLDENNFVCLFMPSNLAIYFHPLTCENVNSGMHRKVKKQLDDGKNVFEVNIETNLSKMKQIDACWIINLDDEFCNSNEMITKTIQMASITKALTSESIGDEDSLALLSPVEIRKICLK